MAFERLVSLVPADLEAGVGGLRLPVATLSTSFLCSFTLLGAVSPPPAGVALPAELRALLPLRT